MMRSKAAMSKQLLGFYLLLISFILFASALPSSRGLKSSSGDISVPHFVAQRNWRETARGDGTIEGRMDLERNDYPDPGPNKGHDPSVPGTG